MNLNEAVRREIARLERTKTFKKETVIESEQGAVVRVAGKDAVMLASNNYLGLASDPRIKQAAIRGVRDYGYGVSSVRFLCGTLTVHRQLEEKSPAFWELKTLFSSPRVLRRMKAFLRQSSTKRWMRNRTVTSSTATV